MDMKAFRQELTEIQEEIDVFDDNWDYDTSTFEAYNEARKPLLEKLEAWYAKERELFA